MAEGEYSECACCGGVDDQDDGDDYALFSRGSVSTSVVDSVGPRSDGESESSASGSDISVLVRPQEGASPAAVHERSVAAVRVPLCPPRRPRSSQVFNVGSSDSYECRMPSESDRSCAPIVGRHGGSSASRSLRRLRSLQGRPQRLSRPSCRRPRRAPRLPTPRHPGQ